MTIRKGIAAGDGLLQEWTVLRDAGSFVSRLKLIICIEIALNYPLRKSKMEFGSESKGIFRFLDILKYAASGSGSWIWWT